MSEQNETKGVEAPVEEIHAGPSRLPVEGEVARLNRILELDLPEAVAAVAGSPATPPEAAWRLTQAVLGVVARSGSALGLLRGSSPRSGASSNVGEAEAETALGRLAQRLEEARVLADDARTGISKTFQFPDLAEGRTIVSEGKLAGALAEIAEIVRQLDDAQRLCDRLDSRDPGPMTIGLDSGTEAALVLAALERLPRGAADPVILVLGALAELAELPPPATGIGHAALPCGMHATYRAAEGGVTLLALRATADQAIDDTARAEAGIRTVLSPAIARRDRRAPAVLEAWARSRNLEGPFAPLGEIRRWTLGNGWFARGFGLRSGRLLLILGVGRDRSRLDRMAAAQVALIERLQGRLDAVRQRGPQKVGSQLDASAVRRQIDRPATEGDSDR